GRLGRRRRPAAAVLDPLRAGAVACPRPCQAGREADEAVPRQSRRHAQAPRRHEGRRGERPLPAGDGPPAVGRGARLDRRPSRLPAARRLLLMAQPLDPPLSAAPSAPSPAPRYPETALAVVA